MQRQSISASDLLQLSLTGALTSVEFLGEHPQLLCDLAAKGALRQGNITCCAPSGRRIWAPLCVEDSRVSVVTDPPQRPMTLRSGQFWQVYSDMDCEGMVRGSEILHVIREFRPVGSIRTKRWSLAGSCSLFDPPVGTLLSHDCLPLEHQTGHSTSKVDLFPTTKPNIFRSTSS